MSANLIGATAEVYESGVQVTSAFDDQLARVAEAEPALAKMDRLDLALALNHPVAGFQFDRKARPPARFARSRSNGSE